MSLTAQEKIVAMLSMKHAYLKTLKQRGETDKHTRLDGSDPENYVTDPDIAEIADWLGYHVLLSSSTALDDEPVKIGFAPHGPLMHVSHCMVAYVGVKSWSQYRKPAFLFSTFKGA